MIKFETINENICFTQEDYKGEKDYDNIYLGFDRTSSVNPEVTLSAVMQNSDEVDAFFEWMDNEINNGVEIFLLKDITLFGKMSTYAVRFISKVNHSITSAGINKISMKVEVLYSSADTDNKAPSANSLQVSVDINSGNNVIKLSGTDPEADPLLYEIVSQPTKGKLTGSGANQIYVPYTDSVGEDKFTYIVKDYFNSSTAATVAIVIGQIEKPTAEFEYNVIEKLTISGNFYYDIGNGIPRRGSDAEITPVATDCKRDSVATYIDGGLLKYAGIDQPRFIGANILIEGESKNLAKYSDDIGGTGWGLNYVTHEEGSYAPDGSKHYSLITATSADNECRARQDNITGLKVNEPFTISYFVKYVNSDFIRPFIRGRGKNGELIYGETAVGYQFSTDSFLPYNTDYVKSVESEKLVEGGVRISITYLPSCFQSYYPMTVYLNLSKNGLRSRANIGDAVEMFGFQIEQGSKSSYIVTTDTQVTRARDIPEGKVIVWSNDHVVVNNENVTSVKVNNWGERENYQDFFSGYPNINTLSWGEAEGECEGTIFTRMFKNYPKYFPPFNTSNGVYFNSFVENCGSTSFPKLDLKNGIYFQSFGIDSSITTYPILDTVKGQYMQDFFRNSALVCCAGINTEAAINKSNMFKDTNNVVNPNSTWINNLIGENGDNYDLGEACAISLHIIPKTYSPGQITELDGSALCSGTYEVIYSGNDGTETIAWTCDNGTIVGANDQSIVTVEDMRTEDTTISLECTISTATQSNTTGLTDFKQRVEYTYLVITLPKRFSLINLRDEIDLQNPNNFTDISVLNDKVNCSMTSGGLLGLNVVLINTGQLQGFAAGDTDAMEAKNNGLTVTSPMKLVNKGYIRGCGGHGGKGGKGKNSTINRPAEETRYDDNNRWAVSDDYKVGLNVSWNGVSNGFSGTDENDTYYENYTGPIIVSGVSIMRGDYETSGYDRAGTYTRYYKVVRIYEVTVQVEGGAGGLGGNGCSYNESFDYNSEWREGGEGYPSVPTGGNSGGKGGNGGWWGTNGYTGARGEPLDIDGVGTGDFGEDGKKGGFAIDGINFLKPDSTIGIISGGTTGEIVYPPIDPSKFIWYTFEPDNMGWSSTVDGNFVKVDATKINVNYFPGSGVLPDGEVYASNHIFLDEGQEISIPDESGLTESVTYYSPDDNTFKTVPYVIGKSENLIQNGDFSDGLNYWSPNTSVDWDWTHVTPNGCQLDLRVDGGFAICTTFLTSPIAAGETVELIYDTELIDDYGVPYNLFNIQLNTNEVNFNTRGGHHEYTFTHSEDILNLRLTRSSRKFKGVFRNVSIKKFTPLKIKESCSNILTLSKILIQEDITYLNENPNALMEMLKDIPHPGLSFEKSDIIGYYPGWEIYGDKLYSVIESNSALIYDDTIINDETIIT